MLLYCDKRNSVLPHDAPPLPIPLWISKETVVWGLKFWANTKSNLFLICWNLDLSVSTVFIIVNMRSIQPYTQYDFVLPLNNELRKLKIGQKKKKVCLTFLTSSFRVHLDVSCQNTHTFLRNPTQEPGLPEPRYGSFFLSSETRIILCRNLPIHKNLHNAPQIAGNYCQLM